MHPKRPQAQPPKLGMNNAKSSIGSNKTVAPCYPPPYGVILIRNTQEYIGDYTAQKAYTAHGHANLAGYKGW